MINSFCRGSLVRAWLSWQEMGWWLSGTEVGSFHDLPVLTAPGVTPGMKLCSCPGLRVSVRDWATAQRLDLLQCVGITALKQGEYLFKNKMTKPCICVQRWLAPRVSATVSSHVGFCLLNYITTFAWFCINRGTRKMREGGGERLDRL